MLLSRTALLSVLLVCLLTGCGPKWEDFTPPGGEFKVKMPVGTKKDAGSALPGGSLYKYETDSLVVEAGSMDLGQLAPSGRAANIDPQIIYSSIKSAVAGASGGKVASDGSATLGGQPGYEIEIDVPAGRSLPNGKKTRAHKSISRMALVGTKLYLVAYSASGVTRQSKAVTDFFDSFQLTGAAGASAPTMAPPGGTMPPPDATAGMPGMTPPGMTPPGTAPGMTPGMTPPGMTPGMTPPGTAPAATTNLPPGVTIGGAPPMTTPMPGAYPGGYPMPGATPPGTAPASPGATNAPALPPGVTIGGTTPMPGATPGYPPPGTTPMPAGGFPGTTPNGAAGTGQGQAPKYTGTPIEADTNVAKGDKIQVWVNNRWVDANVINADNAGIVRVRPAGARSGFYDVARNLTQYAPGVSPGATADPDDKPGLTARTKPSSDDDPKPTGSADLESASVEELLAMATNKTDYRRHKALVLLKEHSNATPDEKVSEGLVGLLTSKERTSRIEAALALEKWGTDNITEPLLPLLDDQTAEVRQAAMSTLGKRGLAEGAAGIAKGLKQASDRKAAIAALSDLGEAAEPEVLKMLAERDDKTRQAACDALKAMGTKESIPELQRALKDWSGLAKVAARQALQAIERRQ